MSDGNKILISNSECEIKVFMSWRTLSQDDKKLRVDFGFTPNDILKFQKLVAQNEDDIEEWFDEVK